MPVPLTERLVRAAWVVEAHADAPQAVRDARGWPHDANPALRARRFWALALGCVLRGAATGSSQKDCATDMLALLLDSDAFATPAAVSPRLFAVISHTPVSRMPS